MKTWTRQAQERLQEYLEARVRRDGLEGEDAAELRADLARHVHEEVGCMAAERVGVADVSRVLGELEGGRGWEAAPAEKAAGPRARFGYWAGGVVMPVVVLLWEVMSGFCGGVFFDPVPDVWHMALVAAVPVANAWLLTRGARVGSWWQGMVAGAATLVAGFYALLFAPLLPASVIALVFFGIGLLSLTPLMAWLATWRLSRRRRASAGTPWRFRAGWRTGAAAAVTALVLLEGPAVWTRWQLSQALAADRGTAEAAVERLRVFHSERTLLRACYEGNRGTSMGTDIAGWFGKGWSLPLAMFGARVNFEDDSEAVRNLFFRVTGTAFNALPPPRMVRDGGMFGRGRARVFEDLEFDSARGGDQVSVRLKDLDLAGSRFDGHVDSRSRIGYGEWTMVFHNAGIEAKEARCQVRLPRGGRVSRLTLWINGEPREAAFNRVEKVRAAYQEVAVAQRRDPVLVTMSGPDTVLVQCFPVPAGGEMKIRFGLTAPLDDGRWELPRVVERNFGLAAAGEHALWLQADRAFDILGPAAIPGSAKDGDGQSCQTTLALTRAFAANAALRMDLPPGEPPVVWCEDRFAAAAERFLERKPRLVNRPPAGKLVVVVDGSASMAGDLWWIADLLEKQFSPGTVEILLADDGVRRLDPRQLRVQRLRGGRDNEPALREAVAIAKAAEHGAVVWLHGPQAVKFAESGALLQMLERGTRRPVIHQIQVVDGPNRLAESLGRGEALRRGPALLDPRADLADFLQRLCRGGVDTAWEWRRAADARDMTGEPVWHQLALEWAIDESETAGPRRAETAAAYQLVTPVSGAVVLETAEQYARHGLQPVDAAAVPSIPAVPEPSTALLAIAGAATMLLRRRRRAMDR